EIAGVDDEAHVRIVVRDLLEDRHRVVRRGVVAEDVLPVVTGERTLEQAAHGGMAVANIRALVEARGENGDALRHQRAAAPRLRFGPSAARTAAAIPAEASR